MYAMDRVVKSATYKEVLDLIITGDSTRCERRHDGTWLEQVWMIAHLAQLHEAVDDAHVVAAGKAFTGLGTRHKIIIQEALSLIHISEPTRRS